MATFEPLLHLTHCCICPVAASALLLHLPHCCICPFVETAPWLHLPCCCICPIVAFAPWLHLPCCCICPIVAFAPLHGSRPELGACLRPKCHCVPQIWGRLHESQNLRAVRGHSSCKPCSPLQQKSAHGANPVTSPTMAVGAHCRSRNQSLGTFRDPGISQGCS